MAGLEAEEPTAWTFREIKVSYHRPARRGRRDDVQHPSDSLTGARHARVQQVICGETLLVDGQIEACIITLTGKPRRLPAKRCNRFLTPFLSETDT